MSEIKVTYIDGTTEIFPETSRPGGSYHTSYKCGNGFLTITDAWGKETVIPDFQIRRVETNHSRY